MSHNTGPSFFVFVFYLPKLIQNANDRLQEIEDALYLGGVLAKPIKWDMYCQTHFIRVNFTVCSLRARRDLCPLGGMPPTW